MNWRRIVGLDRREQTLPSNPDYVPCVVCGSPWGSEWMFTKGLGWEHEGCYHKRRAVELELRSIVMWHRAQAEQLRDRYGHSSERCNQADWHDRCADSLEAGRHYGG